MKNIKYHIYLVATASCTNRMIAATKGVGQRDLKGATKDRFLFESWFSSNKLA